MIKMASSLSRLTTSLVTGQKRNLTLPTYIAIEVQKRQHKSRVILSREKKCHISSLINLMRDFHLDIILPLSRHFSITIFYSLDISLCINQFIKVRWRFSWWSLMFNFLVWQRIETKRKVPWYWISMLTHTSCFLLMSLAFRVSRNC